MPRRRDCNDDAVHEEEEEEEEEEEDESYRRRKRRRSDFIDDLAEEDDEDDDNGGTGGSGRRRPRRRTASEFFDLEAAVDTDDDEEEEDGEDDFIVDGGAEIPDEDGGRREYRHRLLPQEDQEEDLEELTRSIKQRYARSAHVEYDEEATDHVEQQALLPSVRDPKLWMVKCESGHERKVAGRLMQEAINRGSELQIRSVVALDHLQNYIYIEACKEAHVREACKGIHNIYAANIKLVPIKEMTDVLTVECEAVDIARGTWVRMKRGTYKGDLAMAVHVNDMDQRVIVKLIPRVDLHALANKEGREVPKKKAVIPPPRLMNIDEARKMKIFVERKQDTRTGDYFDNIGSMSFRDGFLYKTVALKSTRTQNIRPTFDELEKFRQLDEGGNGDVASLSTFFANRKKVRFMKGDHVIVVKGELSNMKGHVEKVEEDIVHIRLDQKDLAVETLAFSDKELCKYFEKGNHVKVISGLYEGATGMVESVEGHVVNIISDITKERLQVLADKVVQSSEVTSDLTRIGEYELHDLVKLDNENFGVIIRVHSEAFQVLKGMPGRPEVALVGLREIKEKVEKKGNAQDRFKNQFAVKDMVKVIEGPYKGKQGPVKHIFRGIVFIHDRHHLEHAGFICAKSQSCELIGGSGENCDRNGKPFSSRLVPLRTPSRAPQSPMRSSGGGPAMSYGGRQRGGRGDDALVGADVKIRLGPFKGCKGRVVAIQGTSVRVELEAQMKVVSVDRNHIADNDSVSTAFREPYRHGLGSETPSHPSRTPLHPSMTPIRDHGATPIHDGMRTPMVDRAWNPMSPPRYNWEVGNAASWGSSPEYQLSSPRSTAYQE
ncbi:putative transcription elongation factor SPT5 homolog 1 [Nicotiana tabacum]|uniref:Transcription elongation factor SPT5 homolog 1 n=1 Tax=Nicotiana tabacum TaxID=4097 RepID=A0AC58RM76_TOBAC